MEAVGIVIVCVTKTLGSCKVQTSNHSFNALVFFSPRGPVKGLKGEETRGNVIVVVFSMGRTERIGDTPACVTLVICCLKPDYQAWFFSIGL